MKNNELKRQKGFTLVEVGVVLVIGALITAGAMALYSSTSMTQKVNQLTSDVAALGTAAQSSAAATGTYGTASLNEYLLRSNKVPKSITVTGTSTLLHSFSGQIDVQGLTNHYYIHLSQIPGEACVNLYTQATSWSRVSVGTAPSSGNVTTVGDNAPFTQQNAIAACGAVNSSNDMYFVR
jgi:prepilin-type N-terminal cleavage/methylation domain-containing protein